MISSRLATRLRSACRSEARLLSTFPKNKKSSPALESSEKEKKFSSAAIDQNEAERIQLANESQRALNAVPVVDSPKPASAFSHSKFRSIGNLTSRIAPNAIDDRIKMTEKGERAFFLDSVPMVSQQAYRENNAQTADWMKQVLMDESSKTTTVFYVGFEAFYDLTFESMAEKIEQSGIPLVFSPLVKSSREYIQNRTKFDSVEATKVDWQNRVVIHLGASHAMDRLLFKEDESGHLQSAWTDGRLIIMSPELVVADQLIYRAGLSPILKQVVGTPADPPPHQIKRVKTCDFTQLDRDIAEARRRVDDAQSMEEAFLEVYSLVIKYIEKGELDSPLYFDSGWESFHLYKSLSQRLEAQNMKVPWTRLALINARNAAIGDSLHTFYATAPQAFPFVVVGDTAALLAGGISMLNMHAQDRFGVVIIPNNRGMAIEDVISKRSVDGHQYQYEYVKLDRKRDVFSLKQLKDVIKQDVLASLRDHLWGVSSHRSEALVLNIDVQSLRRENAKNASSDAVLMGGSFLSEDFGERFKELEHGRKRLESIVEVLYGELNSGSAKKDRRSNVPVKIQGCSAIEFMEIMSQLSITMRDKLKFLPTPTDLLATRTLLSSLIESPRRTISVPDSDSNFVNSNNTFSVFISNAAFGLDGLNNLISTHLEYGTGTLVHLAYDAADVVTHYSLIGQVHRNFGIRPSTILPSLYRNHQVYDGQVMVVKNATDENYAPEQVLKGLRDPEVKVILVDMGAPNLTASLK